MAAIHSSPVSNQLSALSAKGSPTSHHQQLVKQSQRLVSQTFFGTLLKQMHDSPFKSDMLDGGKGGKAFSTLLDQHLADHMGSGVSGRKLVDSIVRKIESKEAGKKEPKPARKPQLPSRFSRGGYFKAPATNGRPNVPADFRA